VCDSHDVFRRWVLMAEHCPRCGLHFQRDAGQWLGSWFLNVCLAQAAVALVVFVGVLTSDPRDSWPLLTLASALTAVAVPVAFFPSSRMMWTAIDLAMRPLDLDDGVPPGWELDDLVAEERARLDEA
jgi:hypothetical protein